MFKKLYRCLLLFGLLMLLCGSTVLAAGDVTIHFEYIDGYDAETDTYSYKTTDISMSYDDSILDYSPTVGAYGNQEFDHWEINGSKVDESTVASSLFDDSTATAVYNTVGHIIRIWTLQYDEDSDSYDYLEPTVLHTNASGRVTLPAGKAVDGTPFEKWVDADGNTVTSSTVFAEDTDVYAMYEGQFDGASTYAETSYDFSKAVKSYKFGDHLTGYLMDEDGDGTGETLVLDGYGDMYDFSYSDGSNGEFYCSLYVTEAPNITKVVLDSDITKIGKYAFHNLSAACTDTLPSGLTSIGSSAFSGCSKMTISGELPSGLTSIGNNAFISCSKMTISGELPSGLTSIGYCVFRNCSNMAISGELPNGLTSIGSYAFCDCSKMTISGELPSGLTSIGSFAFDGCSKMTISGELPSGLTSIGKSAFDGCYSMIISGELPSGLTSIGNYAFRGCSKMTISGELPSGLTSIGNYAFSGCSSMTISGSLPSGLTSISNYAFSGCSSMTISGSLPSGLTSIGDSAFSGCSNMTISGELPSGLTSIGAAAFKNCSKMTISESLPAGLTSIADSAFSGCWRMRFSGELPGGLTRIGSCAFENCVFDKLIIPDSITSIGHDAFRVKYKVAGIAPCTDITIGTGVTSIGTNAFGVFNGSTSIISEPVYTKLTTTNEYVKSYNWEGDGRTTKKLLYTDTATSTKYYDEDAVKTYAFGDNLTGYLFDTNADTVSDILVLDGYGDMYDFSCGGNRNGNFYCSLYVADAPNITKVVLDPDITKIGECAFYNLNEAHCAGELPSGLTSIGDRAFWGCSNMTISGTLPSGLTSIGDGAFINCSKMTISGELPSGLTSISSSAFFNCSKMTISGSLPSGLTSIGDSAFYGCSNMTISGELPSGLTSIGSQAFDGCSNMTISGELPSGLTRISTSAFYECSNMTISGELPSGLTSIGNCPFYGCSSMTISGELPSGLTSIGGAAFKGCSNMTISGELPSGLTSIGSGAFENCSNMTISGKLPSGLTSIESSTFNGCSSMTISGELPSGLTRIGYSAFEGCSSMAISGELPSGLASIGSSAFDGCSQMTISGSLPSGLTSIGSYAFDDCSSMTISGELPSGLTSIGGAAFRGCLSMTISGELPSGLTSISAYAFDDCSSATISGELPSGLISIGIGAFRNCNFSKLIIPDSVTTIGEKAFAVNYNTTGITPCADITIGSGVTSIGTNAFGVYKGSSFIISEPMYTKLTTTNEYVKSYNWTGDGRTTKKLLYTDPATSTKYYDEDATEVVQHLGLDCYIYADGTCIVTGTQTADSSESAYTAAPWYTRDDITRVVANYDAVGKSQCAMYKDSKFEQFIPGPLLDVSKVENMASMFLYSKLTELDLGEFFDTTNVTDMTYMLSNCYNLIAVDLGENFNTANVQSMLYMFSNDPKLQSISLGDKFTTANTTNVSGMINYMMYKLTEIKGTITTGNLEVPLPRTMYQYPDNTEYTALPANTAATAYDLHSTPMPPLYTDSDGTEYRGADAVKTYAFGDNLTGYLFDTDADTVGDLLVLDGYGDMYDFSTTWVSSIRYCSLYSAEAPNITKVVLDPDITKVGDYAFFNLSNATCTDTLPSGLTSVGCDAFSGCSNMTISGELPSGLTNIDDSAFRYCSKMTISGKLSSGLTSIGYSAFQDCSSMTISGSLPNGLTSVGAWTFDGCSNMTISGELPSGLTSIGDRAFRNCSKMTISGELPSGLTTIEQYAFSNCSKMTISGELPSGLTTIGQYAFRNCSSMTISGELPSGLTSIGDYAFKNCSNMTISGELPSGLTSIGSEAFTNCSFDKLVIPDSVTTIGERAFAVNYYAVGVTPCTDITIGSGVTPIGTNAFGIYNGSASIVSTPVVTKLTTANEYVKSYSWAGEGRDVGGALYRDESGKEYFKDQATSVKSFLGLTGYQFSDGTYIITGTQTGETGGLTSLNANHYTKAPWCKNSSITRLVANYTTNGKSQKDLFRSCYATSWIAGPKFDLTSTSNLTQMFQDCSKLTSVDFGSGFNAASISSASNMFKNCSKVDLVKGHFTTGSTALPLYTTMYAWRKNTSYSNIPANTNAYLELRKSQYTSVLRYTSNSGKQYWSGDAIEWGTHLGLDWEKFDDGLMYVFGTQTEDSVITSDSDLWMPEHPDVTCVVADYNANGKSQMGMFASGTFFEWIAGPSLNTEGVGSMMGMFLGCQYANKIDLGANFDTRSAEDMQSMFLACASLDELYLPANFDTTLASESGNDRRIFDFGPDTDYWNRAYKSFASNVPKYLSLSGTATSGEELYTEYSDYFHSLGISANDDVLRALKVIGNYPVFDGGLYYAALNVIAGMNIPNPVPEVSVDTVCSELQKNGLSNEAIEDFRLWYSINPNTPVVQYLKSQATPNSIKLDSAVPVFAEEASVSLIKTLMRSRWVKLTDVTPAIPSALRVDGYVVAPDISEHINVSLAEDSVYTLRVAYKPLVETSEVAELPYENGFDFKDWVDSAHAIVSYLCLYDNEMNLVDSSIIASYALIPTQLLYTDSDGKQYFANEAAQTGKWLGIDYYIFDDGLCYLCGEQNEDSDLSKYESSPWYQNESIKTVVADYDANGYSQEYMFREGKFIKWIGGSFLNVSTVTNMSLMFDGCSLLTCIDLGNNFNTSSTTSIGGIFQGCSGLTTIDLGTKFDTSNITDMTAAFCSCTSLTSLNLGDKFDTSNVTSMLGMFLQCYSITDLSFISNFIFNESVNTDDMLVCHTLEEKLYGYTRTGYLSVLGIDPNLSDEEVLQVALDQYGGDTTNEDYVLLVELLPYLQESYTLDEFLGMMKDSGATEEEISSQREYLSVFPEKRVYTTCITDNEKFLEILTDPACTAGRAFIQSSADPINHYLFEGDKLVLTEDSTVPCGITTTVAAYIPKFQYKNTEGTLVDYAAGTELDWVDEEKPCQLYITIGPKPELYQTHVVTITPYTYTVTTPAELTAVNKNGKATVEFQIKRSGYLKDTLSYTVEPTDLSKGSSSIAAPDAIAGSFEPADNPRVSTTQTENIVIVYADPLYLGNWSGNVKVSLSN